MSRTNIDLDDELVAEVMRRFGVTTKKSAVELALRRLLVTPRLTEELLVELEGSGYPVTNDELEDDDQASAAAPA
jgi:Arc/MetJ family transcription regulator